MVVSVQQIRFAKDSSGTEGATQDVNLNFTPKAIIVFSSGGTQTSSVEAEYQTCIGFSDGTNHTCITTGSDDGSNAADTGRLHRNDAVFARLSQTVPTTTTESYASCAFSTNKVTFTWTLNDTAATYIHMIAFGGDAITNAKVNTVQVNTTSTGNIDYTGLGFTPASGEGVLFTLGANLAAANTNSTAANGSFGCGVSSSKRWAIGSLPENAADPSDTWSYHSSSNCLLNQTSADGTLYMSADFVSWISDGFRLNWTDAPGASNVLFGYLVIKGGTWDAGTLTSPTSPTNNVDTAVSVSSLTLRGLLMASVGVSTLDSAIAEARWSVGATDGTTQGVASTHDEDAQTTMDSYRVNNTANITFPLTTNGATLAQATFDSFTTNNFRLDWGTAAAALNYSWVVVADGASTLFERAITESSISVSDSNVRTFIQPRSISESSIAVSETNARMLTAFRTIDESSVVVSEDLQRVLTAMHTLDESGISVSEQLDYLRTAFASLPESVSISDSLERILYAFRTISESSIVLSETVSGNIFFERTINESAISVSESLERLLVAFRRLDEDVDVSDSVDRILTAMRTITESSIAVSDSLQTVFIQVRAISESSIEVSETLERLLIAVRSLPESVAVSDSLERILYAFRTLSESSIAVSETVDRTFYAFRTMTESAIEVSETLNRLAIIQRSLSESTIDVSDTLDRTRTAFAVISEGAISVSETLARMLTAFRTLGDTIAVSETLNRILTSIRSLSADTISVSDSVAAVVPIRERFITEATITVNDQLNRLLSAFRTITDTTVNVSDVLVAGIVPPELAAYITDAGYKQELKCLIRFVDRKDRYKTLYEYNSFFPQERPFTLLGASVRLAQGEIGAFSIEIEDSANAVNIDNIGFNSKVEIEVKKELGGEWVRLMTGFVRRVQKVRSATNSLIYRINGYGAQVVFNERVTNYKRAAKRTAVDSIDPLPTDSRMFASNLFGELITATDILPLRGPSLAAQAGFTIDEISQDVQDFIAAVAPGLTDASAVANAFSELTGAIWGVNSEGKPFFRYPTAKHSGIIIKDDPQDTDSALNTSINMGPFDYEDTIDLAEGFANRLYVLNAVDTKSTASSSGASGSTTLSFRGIAQQFTAKDNNIRSAAFILSKVGNPQNKDNVVFGKLRGDKNGYPVGPTLATFQITFDQIETSKSTVFVNDIKHDSGVIIPENKYWWFLFSALTDDSNTVRWHHDNDQTTINRFSATLPFIDQDLTKPGDQLFWTRSDKGPIYAFSTFSSVRHILEHSDPESIDKYGLIEGIVDLPAFEDDNDLQKALVQKLKDSSKPKRIYEYTQVTIPTQRLFFPGELVTLIDSKAKLTSQKNITAEIAEVLYPFSSSQNAMGCRYIDLRLISFVDRVLDDYLDTSVCSE